MAKCSRAGGTGFRRIRPAWLLMLSGVVIVLVAACSSGGADASASSGGGSAGASTGAPAAVTVPLKVVGHGRATLELVPVTIDGQGPFVFMLDTGSSISSVTRRLAARLQLPSAGSTAEVRGVVTSTRVPLVRITGWKLGTAALAPEPVAVVDLGETGGGSVAGLLGSDELRHFGAITIDFTHQQLRLAKP